MEAAIVILFLLGLFAGTFGALVGLGGGIILNTSWFLGGGADGGWFAYAPNTGVTFSPSHGMDFYAIGLQITGKRFRDLPYRKHDLSWS